MTQLRMLAIVTTAVVAARALQAQHDAAAHQQASEKLGTVHFATSCDPRGAAEFDRSVALLHSFEFGPAIRGFNAVLARDSSCAMAYWGMALARWTNPFAMSSRSGAQLKAGQDAAAQGLRVSATATERERGYLAAVSTLYAHADRLDQRARVVAYERAMRDLAERQPADTEAKIFYALALAGSASLLDKTYANQLKAGSILEPLWAVQPDHPGLAHYIIHSYDFPPLADRARRAAQRYAGIAPSAAHALHMPSHTFTRVGLWKESVSTNARSFDAAMGSGGVGEALHASDYAVYAYLQMRNDSAAKRILDGLPALRARFDPDAIVGAAPGSAGVFALASIPARYVIERRAWTEAAALEVTPSAFPYTEAMTYFVRALGAGHTGDLASARIGVDSLASIRDRLASTNENYWSEQVAIQQLGALSWLRLAEGKSADAVEILREAARREDASDKSAVTPGPLAPAHELLGDILMELKRPAEALAEYRATLTREPNRYRSLDGAIRAASAAGDRAAEQGYQAQLDTLTGGRVGRP